MRFRDIFVYATIETLSSFLQNKKKHQQEFIRPTKEKPYYPITPSQYAIWLACQNDKRLLVYNMSKVYMIEGNINREVLNQAFIKIIRKHEILRTNFVEYQGIPSQKIRSKEDSSFKIDYKEVEDLIIDDYIEEYILYVDFTRTVYTVYTVVPGIPVHPYINIPYIIYYIHPYILIP